MAFYCSRCGREHDEFPALAFIAPDSYVRLSEVEKRTIASTFDDFCVIEYDSQTDRFIRAVIRLPIRDCSETLEYGVWVSLSERSFSHYQENFDTDIEGQGYFGYLNNNIPGFPDTLHLKMNVECGKAGQRPFLVPHRDQLDHAFVHACFDGVTMDFELDRLHELLDK